MKRALRFVLLSVAAVMVAGLALLSYKHVTHVHTFLEKSLGLRDFTVVEKVYTSHQFVEK